MEDSAQAAGDYRSKVEAEKSKLIKQIFILMIIALIISLVFFFSLYKAVEL